MKIWARTTDKDEFCIMKIWTTNRQGQIFEVGNMSRSTWKIQLWYPLDIPVEPQVSTVCVKYLDAFGFLISEMG